MSNIRDIFERARKTSIREAVEATFTPEIRAALGLPQAEKAIVRYPNKTPLIPEPLPLGPVSPPEVKPLGIAPPVAP